MACGAKMGEDDKCCPKCGHTLYAFQNVKPHCDKKTEPAEKIRPENPGKLNSRTFIGWLLAGAGAIIGMFLGGCLAHSLYYLTSSIIDMSRWDAVNVRLGTGEALIMVTMIILGAYTGGSVGRFFSYLGLGDTKEFYELYENYLTRLFFSIVFGIAYGLVPDAVFYALYTLIAREQFLGIVVMDPLTLIICLFIQFVAVAKGIQRGKEYSANAKI